jgi:hypothetical protein
LNKKIDMDFGILLFFNKIPFIRPSKEGNRHQFFEDDFKDIEFLEIYEDIISKLNTYFN